MLLTQFDPFPVITSERLVLREITAADAEAMFEQRSDVENMRFIPRPVAQTIDDALTVIEMMRSGYSAGERINWAITLKGNSRMIGTVGFVHMAPANNRAEVGYMLARPHHGKGIMQEAVEALIRFGVKEMGLHSVEAIIMSENSASARLIEKCGFERVGLMKHYHLHRGEYVDSLLYEKIVS